MNIQAILDSPEEATAEDLQEISGRVLMIVCWYGHCLLSNKNGLSASHDVMDLSIGPESITPKSMCSTMSIHGYLSGVLQTPEVQAACTQANQGVPVTFSIGDSEDGHSIWGITSYDAAAEILGIVTAVLEADLRSRGIPIVCDSH